MDDILANLGGRISATRLSVVWVRSINFEGNMLVMISGELDMLSVPVADEALAIVVGGPATTAVDLDVSAVSYIDISGLHCLVRAHRRAMESSCTFRLMVGQSAVQRLLSFTQLGAPSAKSGQSAIPPHFD